MKKIDKLAQEQFNGDLEAAITYIFNNCSTEVVDEYVEEFEKEHANIAMRVINGHIKANGLEEEVSAIVKEEISLDNLQLTKEEVMNAEKNPFKAKINKQLLKLFIMESGIVALNLLASSLGISTGIINSVGAILTAGVSTSFGVDLVKYFQFKKLKKQYSLQNTEEISLEQQGRAR